MSIMTQLIDMCIVHVVHKTSEPPALLAAEDGDEDGDDDD